MNIETHGSQTSIIESSTCCHGVFGEADEVWEREAARIVKRVVGDDCCR